MSFIRESTGLNNYRDFLDVDITVYIEGQEGKHDKDFYQSLIKIYTTKKVAFIPKGNCDTVFDYLESIVSGNVENAFVIFDKDLTGLTISKRLQKRMLTTCFYSWENDLLDKMLVYDYFSDNCLDFELRSKFLSIFHRELVKFQQIVINDALSQRLGAYILNKDKASGGVNFAFNYSNLSIITDQEINRLSSKINLREFEFDEVFMSLRNEFSLYDIRMYIQGHFYEYFCYKLVQFLIDYKDPNFKVLNQKHFMTTIVGKFSKSPRVHLNDEVYEHYLKEFTRVFEEINYSL